VNIIALTASQTAIDNPAAINTWLDQVGKEGHTVTPLTLPADASVQSVWDIIQSHKPNHTQLFGRVPLPLVRSVIDGHLNPDGTMRAGECVAPYCNDSLDSWWPQADGTFLQSGGFASSPAVRTCSLIDGSNLVQIGTEQAMFDRMMAFNQAYRTGAFDYGTDGCFVDYLDQIQPIRAQIISDLQSVVGGEVHVTDLTTSVDADRWHFFTVNKGKRFLVGGFFDGGIGRDGGVGEYNTGSMADFASGNVMIAVALMFCSNGWMMRYWPLQRALLAGGSVAVLYDPWAQFSLAGWDETTPLATVFLREMRANYEMIFSGVGDYTITRRAGDVAIDPRVDGLLTRVAALETQAKADAIAIAALTPGGGGDTTDTGTAITILSAKYRQVASTTTFKDATAVVQALVASGKPFFVYSDASVNGNGPCLSDPSWGVNPKDPYPGVLKELVVTYSKGTGAAQTVVFGQFAAVVF